MTQFFAPIRCAGLAACLAGLLFIGTALASPGVLPAESRSPSLSPAPDIEIAELELEIAKLEREKRHIELEHRTSEADRVDALAASGAVSESDRIRIHTDRRLAEVDFDLVSVDVKRRALHLEIAIRDAKGEGAPVASKQEQAALAMLEVESARCEFERTEILLEAAMRAMDRASELAAMGAAEESDIQRANAGAFRADINVRNARRNLELRELHLNHLQKELELDSRIVPLEHVWDAVRNREFGMRLRVDQTEAEIHSAEIEVNLRKSAFERLSLLAEQNLAPQSEAMKAETALRQAELSREQMMLKRQIHLRVLESQLQRDREGMDALARLHDQREALLAQHDEAAHDANQERLGELHAELDGIEAAIISATERLLTARP